MSDDHGLKPSRTQAPRERLLAHGDERHHECLIQERAYKLRIATVTPANWLTIAAPAVLSAFAGATSLGVLFGSLTPQVAGVSALAAALLASLHKSLDCDGYQAKCSRMIQAYSALAASYSAVKIFGDDRLAETLTELDASFAATHKSAEVILPERVIARAKAELSHG